MQAGVHAICAAQAGDDSHEGQQHHTLTLEPVLMAQVQRDEQWTADGQAFQIPALPYQTLAPSQPDGLGNKATSFQPAQAPALQAPTAPQAWHPFRLVMRQMRRTSGALLHRLHPWVGACTACLPA